MALVDQFGKEIQVKKQPETREIAVTTVRDRWTDYPSSGLTPQRLGTIFKEADMGDVHRQAELFEEMEEKDTHLFSELQTRKNAITGLDYDITPYDETPENKKIRDFVADCIFGLEDFEEALLDLLDAIGKGYSCSEIKWEIIGGKAIVSGLSWIHAKKAVFYERGAVNMWAKSVEVPRILTEAQPINGEEMPPFKMVFHRYKARSGYDTRAGLLRVCSWMYLFKNYSIKDWVAFAEVFGMPLRVGKYDPNASAADKASLVSAVQSLGSDAAGIISKNTEIEFIETAKSGSTDNIYEALAEFCDKQMSKAILGQTATTEGTPGKLGNEDAQDKVRYDLIKADAEAISRTIRFQIIRPLVGYNFGWDKQLPWFKLAYEKAEDLANLIAVYKGASDIGQPISAEHISERFKIPMPQKGETILAPRSSSPFSFAAKDKIERGYAGLIIAADKPKLSADDWRVVYLNRLKPALGTAREGALDEIEAYLRDQSVPPGEAAFTSAVQKILNTSVGVVPEATISAAVTDIYNTFRNPSAAISFGGPDFRAINFMSKMDNFYISKWVQNPDASAAAQSFLKERYMENGAGLFGRQNPENLQAFRDLFGQKLAELEDYQVGRIINTSVTRVQNNAALAQMYEGGVAEIEIYEPTQECEFCQAMNGKIISVDLAYKNMSRQMDLSPEQYIAEISANRPTIGNIEAFADKAMLPPYHPNCKGIVIKRMGRR
jgi:phage gp29-like protein